MVTALVLLNVERKRVNEVAEKLVEVEGVTEVYSLAGRHDLAAIVRVKDHEDLAEVVTRHLLAIQGITDSETLVAFRVYSRHDLEGIFSVGLNS